MTDAVVEVLGALSRIASVVKESMVGLENLDKVVADRNRDGIFALFIGLDNLAVAVFHYHLAVNAEVAVFYRIGGILVIDNALDIEAGVVSEVLRVEGKCCR